MTDPIAMTVHPGGGVPAGWRRDLIQDWLTANGIDPAGVYADAPILILTFPYQPDREGGPWFIQVIVFTQLYVNASGAKEYDFLTGGPVRFQRTVPLKTPFPADPTPGDEGSRDGQADRQAAQEAPEVLVRDQVEACVSDPRQGARSGGAVSGEAARIEGAAEGSSLGGHEAVPEPEEDRRQEEVGGP